jgi:hypothetical protein
MPTSLRLGALLFASVSADETVSLMQDAKKTLKTKRDKKPLNSLLEAAKGMLKNGETMEATEFAEETLAEIEATVLPAIEHESETAQTALYTRWAVFNNLIDVQLLEWNEGIDRWKTELDQASATHQACRGVQADKCEGKRTCEMDLYRLHVDWVNQETALRDIHDDLHGHFCPPDANGTLHSFRVAAVPWMESYMTQKEVVETSETNYDNHRPQCVRAHGDLDSQTNVCNQAQRTMESFACDHASAITTTLEQFEGQYTSLMEDWIAYLRDVKANEADRHQEYETIEVVKCLLDRVRELNGRPCDTETGEVDNELATCHAVGEALVVCDYKKEDVPVPGPGGHPWTLRYETFDEAAGTHNFLHHQNGVAQQGKLCLIYPEPAPRPPVCPAGITIGDVFPCLPIHTPKPCDVPWMNAQMATPVPLPEVPQGEFSATNPGCNQYPACEPCPVEHEPQVVMVDGCTTRGHPQNRQAVHASDGHTAHVRCCSYDGDQCFTEALSETCEQLQDKTFAEAVEICAVNGRRLCSEAEITEQLCCTTGCGFDSDHIWVAESSSVYGD